MKLDGQFLADKIQTQLKEDITSLKEQGITPHIAIVTVGDEGTWKAYVARKIALANTLGIKTSVIDMSGKSEEEVKDTVTNLNQDPDVHGIIIQRPIPKEFSEENTVALVSKEKDIDAFRTDSPFKSPVFQGVRTTLESIYKQPLEQALNDKGVVVIGKGTTAGGPTIRGLKENGLNPTVIDSRTENAKEQLKHADVVITAVGKEVLNATDIKRGAIVIGIGARVEQGTLKGDFDEGRVGQVASFYSPTPGGIGPLNVSYLFSNLVLAARNQKS